jgi:hypothetical protein
VPWNRPAWEPVPTPSAVPQPATVPAPEAPLPGPEHPPVDAPVRTRRHRSLTSAELKRIQPLIADGKKAYAIARELTIPYPVVRQHMRDQELVSTNGQGGRS